MDVPLDVEKLAAKLSNPSLLHRQWAIAQAIMAERERAANVADAAELLNPDAGHAQVADTIRRGTDSAGWSSRLTARMSARC